jgi:microcystin-dependent protein
MVEMVEPLFALPNLHGRAPIGPGTKPGLSTRKLGQRSDKKYSNPTINELPPHMHGAALTGTASGTAAAPVSNINGTVTVGNNGASQAISNVQPFFMDNN